MSMLRYSTLLLCCTGLHARQYIHVFIHGTLFVHQTMLIKTEQALTKMGVSTNVFSTLIAQERQKETLCAHELQLGMDLQQIDSTILSNYQAGISSYEKDRIAIYPTLARFKHYLSSYENDTHTFYAFGWEGTLLHESRIRASERLYNALIDLQDAYGSDHAIYLYAHSHGGNVALLLGRIENRIKKKLAIELLALFGLPVQPETNNYAQSPIFKRIMNFYSSGDAVQTLDIFSTQAWSTKRLLPLITPLDTTTTTTSAITIDYTPPKITNIKLLLENDAQAIGHHSLWLYNKTQKIMPCLRKCPLIAIAPTLIDLVSTTTQHDISINIIPQAHSFTIQTATETRTYLA